MVIRKRKVSSREFPQVVKCKECGDKCPLDELSEGVCEECLLEDCPTCDGTGYSGEWDDEEGALDCDECGGCGTL